ncbi:DUF4270 domain-containing protein [Ferruginibacter lapsinanis]|uniref:DUF4270 domain-containing protein n=1 Tax=Ferruginibacter lapsinanis TaxID=563172 RepID=UPI001E54EF7B|nr:DUF4270 domain-containing protein [Ferruginibacter lapsinanis]UEG49267.1 DUF4270 domain-containing protein [Ferruginibacter lapsinanis]
MQRNFLAFVIFSLFFLSFVNLSCTKIDTTTIGDDLIPAVDNVHTFDTTLDINTSQALLFTDSTRIARTANHFIGSINNDPLFGKTNANLYLELKPAVFPYRFGASGDTLNWTDAGVDSVVLCLSYKGLYGDSMIPQNFSVYQMDNNTTNFVDSSYKLNFQPNVTPTKLLGQATVDARKLNQFTYFANRKDSAQNQIRIKLSNAFATELYNRDSTSGGFNNAFHSDSIFKTFYKGFAVVADAGMGGNALFYVNLTDATTRLEIHYRKRNAGKVDTTYAVFPFIAAASSYASVSSHAAYLQRDRTVSEYSMSPDPEALYIQATPGTYANLDIPGLSTFPNSIIHRAEVIVEQIPSTTSLNLIFPAPQYLYMDIVSPGVGNGFKPINYDLSPTYTYNPDNSTLGYFLPSNGVDFSYFGGFTKTKLDNLGNSINYYSFNLSRYVQNTITKRTINYGFRLYAPYNMDYYGYTFPFSNPLGFGRIKVGSGSNPNYKLRMRIIYSKI